MPRTAPTVRPPAHELIQSSFCRIWAAAHLAPTKPPSTAPNIAAERAASIATEKLARRPVAAAVDDVAVAVAVERSLTPQFHATALHTTPANAPCSRPATPRDEHEASMLCKEGRGARDASAAATSTPQEPALDVATDQKIK